MSTARQAAIYPRENRTGAATDALLRVTTAGRQRVAPGAVYPENDGHEPGHRFEWDTGRRLGEWHLVYLRDGVGEVEFGSAGEGHAGVRAGDAIVLPPGVWHRYRPDLQVGWEEIWVGVDGLAAEQLGGRWPERFRGGGVLRCGAGGARLAVLMDRAVESLRRWGPGQYELAAAAAAHALTEAYVLSLRERAVPQTRAEVVAYSREAIRAADGGEVDFRALARACCLSYSRWRAICTAGFGESPKRLELRTRLARAARLLVGPGAPTVQEVAARTGFADASHLTKHFRQRYGMAPGAYRDRDRGGTKAREGTSRISNREGE